MSYNDNQNERPLPVLNQEQKRKSSSHLPRYFRTNANEKFLNSTIDQYIQKGQIQKINSFIGRRTAKATTAIDNFLPDVSKTREDYQLEPATIILDEFKNLEFYKDYNDYINQIKIFRGNTDDHSILNQQEYYSWNPHVDWDKFVNFREYFWLPNGPQPIPVFGQQDVLESTFTVELEDQLDNVAFIFTPDGLTRNPNIKLYRGQTYRFEVNTPEVGLFFRSARTLDPQFDLENVINNGTDNGVIEIKVDINTPDTIYYVASNDINASGYFTIYDIEENSSIDVENEIIGKKNYTLQSGYSLSNGMKVEFIGNVTPEKYASGYWYVDGVGSAIRLINEEDLEVPGTYAQDLSVPFDTEGFDVFPFSNANSFPSEKDYIVINRGSPERSPWSRINRWFHKNVIETSSVINNVPLILDQKARATRPIIEFDQGIKLYNFGTQAKKDVDLVDTFTKDVFSVIEGSTGYNVDGIDLIDGMRVLFTADPDSRVNGRIFKVDFITVNNIRQISLREETDTEPLENETVLVRKGVKNQGNMYFYDGQTWKKAQEKTSLNQHPVFDLFDESDTSLSNIEAYPSSTFKGNSIFSYSVGSGNTDSELGFPLDYRVIENVGDIVFNFDLLSKVYNYVIDNITYTINSDRTYLRVYKDRTNYKSENGWKKAKNLSSQTIIRQYIVETKRNNFAIDVYDRSGDLNDLWYRIYVNNERKYEFKDFEIDRINGIAFVRFYKNLEISDKLLIKTRSSAIKNSNGYYEIPHNLERNPLNNNVYSFTLGEVNDHVLTMVEEIDEFNGIFPGSSNLRDLGNLTESGKKFVQHSGPINLALYHLTDKDANIVKALRYARREYGKFKRLFMQVAENLGFDGPTKTHVDKILYEINKNKTNRMPFYFSDMVPTGGSIRTEHVVLDSDFRYYSMNQEFNLDSVSDRAVSVYKNGVQLIHGSEYVFADQGFVFIKATLAENDLIEIYEYATTNGSYVPPTPSKLGLYPSYEPKIYIDDTYRTPTKVIQGHDGSIVVAYNDYRDDLILELEKRIFNNIKVKYDTTIFNLDDYISGEYRKSFISTKNLDHAMVPDFVDWLKLVDSQDYTKNDFIIDGEPFTYNYKNFNTATNAVPKGFWRGIYKQAYDTDRPHTHPWEMIGFSIKPEWWETVYGPAPYTDNNLVLWQDMENGIVREPGKRIKEIKSRKRPGLTSHIPVDSSGNLSNPLESGFIKNYSRNYINSEYEFGDHSPVESAWRRSSEYPFALLLSCILNQPNNVFSVAYDRSRIIRNKTGQLVYKDTNKRINLSELIFPNSPDDTVRSITAGLVNYIQGYMASQVTLSFKNYKNRLSRVENRISAKLGGFTTKENFNLILDSRTPLNQGNVFIPKENFEIFLNSSSPIETVNYSGVIIEKTALGFKVSGYDAVDPVFKYFKPIESNTDAFIRVGAVSESFVDWKPNTIYPVDQIVKSGNSFYRVTERHTSGSKFDEQFFVRLAELPQTGGRGAYFRKVFEKNISEMPYGTILRKVQDVVDFLVGYGEYLESQGFTFEYFNREYELLETWRTSAQEFLFWTTQNWAAGTVIALSPAANQITFEKEFVVVDNIFDDFYDYSLLKSDGKKFVSEFSNIVRSNENNFSIQVNDNTSDGIYNIKLHLVQKEHVLILDNQTEFRDIIYDQEAGYRQEKIKVIGYRTDDWKGSLDVPGFIFDNVEIKNWEPWADYYIGDVVKYKQFYYSANYNVTGTEFFDARSWNLLPERPQKTLLPNWDYRTRQFADFYDLDSDNFDNEQQKLAQHLIGYQKRQYLENIINDEVSQYKFYQGFIQDKGTKNSLTKLFDVLSNADRDSLEFYEEWAILLGQYGSTEKYDQNEFILNENNFRLEPQPIELVNTIPVNSTDLIIRQRPNDIYLKSRNYETTPLPEKFIKDEFTKSAGYVLYDEITASIANKSNLLTVDVQELNHNDYIWVTDDETKNNEWSVYKIERSNTRIKSSQSFVNDQVQLECDRAIDFNKGDYIGVVTSESDLNGIYRVIDVFSNKIIIESSFSTQTDFDSFGIIYKFIDHRIQNTSELNSLINQDRLRQTDKFWIDDSQGIWKVIENKPVYFENDVINNNKQDVASKFGTTFDVNERNTVMVVGATEISGGEIQIFLRGSANVSWKYRQTIQPENEFSDAYQKFGYSVAITPDEEYIAVGIPLSSNIKTNFKGQYDENITYNFGEIVEYLGTLWQANIDNLTEIPSKDASSWIAKSLIDAKTDGVGSGFVTQGYVEIYKKNIDKTYGFYEAFVSRYPQDNEKFGSKLKWIKNSDNTYKLFVLAEGNYGRVYMLDVGENGTITYSEDREYKGTWILSQRYYQGNKVFYDGVLYSALRNIPSSTITPDLDVTNWQTTSNTIDYLGYLPKDNQNDILLGEETFVDEFENYVTDFDVSKNGDRIIIGLKSYQDTTTAGEIDSTYKKYGKIAVYTKQTDRYVLTQVIRDFENESQTNTGFGDSVSISDDGNSFAVGIPRQDNSSINNGEVRIYEFSPLSHYYVKQILYSPINDYNEQFGIRVYYNGNRLVVSSLMGDQREYTTFDSGNTTFDNKFTEFLDKQIDTGEIYVYEKFDGYLIYSENLDYDVDSTFKNYGKYVKLTDNHIYIGLPESLTDNGLVIDYRKLPNQSAWTTLRQQETTCDVSKIKNVLLYNRKTQEPLAYIDFVDPIQGKIIGVAEQELTFKTYYDPAIYSQGADDGIIIDDLQAWGKNHVGQLWWDLSTVKWLNSHQSDTLYRSNSWNTLTYGSFIDVYEWVESSITPEEWQAIADTENGLSRGISGELKYSVDTYSVAREYNPLSGSFKNKYYFWVRNKVTIPDMPGRKLSALDVARSIENPADQGYRFIAFLDNNKMSLFNCKNLISGDDTVLRVEFYTQENKDINIHSQYQIISDGLETSKPNRDIENKWFDSLTGYDKMLRPVPDLSLPVQQRYGTQTRPRQSWFVNHLEARKQFFERANLALMQQIIVDDFDISTLQQSEPLPSSIQGLYDRQVDTNSDLRFITTTIFDQAIATPIIDNGVIVGVRINNQGRGYQTPPTVKVSGSGYDAELQSIISDGRVVDIIIKNGGFQYDNNTKITIRPYSVLVNSDTEIDGKWAIYYWNRESRTWERSATQSYNVNVYWNYDDWYAPGYSELTDINHVIKQSYELSGLDDNLGDVVRIENIGSGGWLLLRKINNIDTEDYTVNYETIGRQNGTIQFKPNLWDYMNEDIGYSSDNYDIKVYDREPIREMRIILETLRDKIFVDNLSIVYNQLFIASLRYVLSEQKYVDWMFKTSFIKAKHNVGELEQKITFQNDNLPSYEEYIKEVKPYKTKIREYLSSYNKIEPSSTMVTDFDLQPRYSETEKRIMPRSTRVIDNEIYVDENIVSYPDKHWAENLTYEVTEILLKDPGTGWTEAPLITITGGGGTGATAKSYVSNGQITEIRITNSGFGYLSAPQVIIEGSQLENSQPARAVAILGNNPIRHTMIKTKFDRVSGNFEFLPENLNETESFVAPGNKTKFSLKWPISTKVTDIKVYLNGLQAFRSEFTFGNDSIINDRDFVYSSYQTIEEFNNQDNVDFINDFSKQTYTEYTIQNGYVEFTEAPLVGTEIVIEYVKSTELLHAADRINNYYKPTAGMLGNDIKQLMDGIDYGGVSVTGVDLDSRNIKGWGERAWNAGTFDTYSANEFEDIILYKKDIELVFAGNISLKENDILIQDETGATARVIQSTNSTNVLVEAAFDTEFNTEDEVRFDDSSLIDSNNNVPVSVTNYVKVSEPLENNIDYNVYIISNDQNNPNYQKSVRLDDPEYGTLSQTNQNAVMETITGDGITQIFDFINAIDAFDGDEIIIRKITSDGSFFQSDAYDTSIVGGDFAYSTASGLLAEDIIVDGDGFVTPTTSNGPEELVPGHVSDTIDIKVYHRPIGGSSIITSRIHATDGASTEYDLGIPPVTEESIIVKINNQIIDNDEYEIDYVNRKVIFNQAPDAGQSLNIISLSANGENLLEVGTHIADGSTNEFITSAEYFNSVTAFVTVDGVEQTDLALFKTDNSYEYPNRVGINFGSAPQVGQLINYTIFLNAENNYSKMSQEEFIGDGSTFVYNLSEAPFESEQSTFNVLVKVGDKFLNAGYNTEFIVSNDREYQLELWQMPGWSLNVIEVEIYLNGNKLDLTSDYDWVSSESKVILQQGIGLPGDILEVYAIESGDYKIDNSQIIFDTPPANGEKITVYQFNNDKINEFERQSYSIIERTPIIPGTSDYEKFIDLKQGLIKLRKPSIGSQYVWVIKNGTLLTPEEDYTLLSNLDTIRLTLPLATNDEIEVIEFSASKITNSFGYKIFKDMLNRYHYKRMTDQDNMFLLEDLNWYDSNIKLSNTNGLTIPNKENNQPGVVYINGERIEYFIKEGQYLRQLRRGTLGTGVPEKHLSGTIAIDQSNQQNIPYRDNYENQVETTDGTSHTWNLMFNKIRTDDNGNKFIDENEFEVFLAGKRLRKTMLTVYNVDIEQKSPEGDETRYPQFSIDSEQGTLTILDEMTGEPLVPAAGLKLTIVRKLGKVWKPSGVSIVDANNQISKFIMSKTLSIPK